MAMEKNNDIMAGKGENESFEEGVNHGNTRLPFGLCLRYGIMLPRNATPRDAWEALKGRTGKTPEEFYKEAENELEKDIQYTPLKTIKEAEKYATKFATAVSYSNANIKSINTVNETLTNLTNKYPIKTLQHIKTNGRLKNTNARANGGLLEIRTEYLNNETTGKYKDSWHNVCERAIEIFNKLGMRKEAKLREYQNKFNCFTVSYSFSREDSIKSTLSHEYGHIVADQYFGQVNRTRYCNDYANTFNKRQKVVETYNRAKANGDCFNISWYSSTSAEEFFAECFASREMGRQLPDYINKTLDEVLRK